MKIKLLRYLLTGLTVASVISITAWGQAANGSINGRVLDPQHAAIPGAAVTVTNTATGVTSKSSTDINGHFDVQALPIGAYTVTVEHTGFQKVTTQAQSLEIGQTRRFDITLPLGSAAQAVTVEAAVSQVETENATVGATVTGSEIHDLPLNGRNTLDLATLQPGVTPGNGAVGGFSVAGGRVDSITYLLDGGLNNDLLSNDVVFNPNPDTIAEFRLLSSDYTAEYGRSGAGVISVVTKSGTNRIHGSAFDFVRNGDLNANTFFRNVNGVQRDTLKRNQFGATLGGPITIPGVVHGHDKLFFFVGYQGQRQSDIASALQTPTFTPAELAGDFSKSGANGAEDGTPDPAVAAFLQANPFFQPNAALAANAVIDPTKINSVATNFIKLGLIPTNANGLVNSVGSATTNNNQINSRVDYAPNSRDKWSLTLGGQRQLSVNPFAHANVTGFPDSTQSNAYFTGITQTHTFTPNVLNEFHFNVQRSNVLQAKPVANLPSAPALGFGITPDLPIAPPNLDWDTGLTLGFSIQGPSNLVGTTWAYTDALTWVHGRNSWKFGGGFSAYQQNMDFDFLGNGDFSFQGQGGNGSGNGYADFLLGIPNFLSQGPSAPTNIRQKTTYAFLQDDWRMTDRLTLSLGLRYEYSSPKIDTRGRSFGLDPGKQSTTFVNAPLGLVFPGDSGVPLGSNFADKDNFAPRLGFAWDPTGHGTTSIRGGAGLFYDVLKGEDNFQYNGQPPFFSSVNAAFPGVGPGQSGPVTFLSNPFAALGFNNPFPDKTPSKNLDFVAAGFLPFAPPGAVYVDPHIHTPYVYQYNLSVEHQFSQGVSGEVNYVGSSSKGLTGSVDENPFVLGTTNRVLNPAALAANGNINSFCQGLATALGIPAASECPFPITESFGNVGFASFNSVESSLSKRVDNTPIVGHAYFTLAYTYGRSIDNSSGFRNNTSTIPAYDHSAFRGPSDFDITHRVVFNSDWGLPFADAWTSGPKMLTSGWDLDPIFSWRNGFPLTPGAGINPNQDPSQPGPSGAGDGFLADAAFAPGVTSVTLLNPRIPGNHFFNKTTFSRNVTAAAPYGLPRGMFRGPGAVNLDLAVVKHTKIGETTDVEIRGEGFNLLNHAEFNNPSLNIRSSNFGRITGTADPRIVQLALRISF